MIRCKGRLTQELDLPRSYLRIFVKQRAEEAGGAQFGTLTGNIHRDTVFFNGAALVIGLQAVSLVALV